MKYIVVLGDGMADYPIDELNEKTPLEYAHTPVMDELAQKSEIGQVHTIPAGMKPGSDTANLSVLGYDPKKYYTGRSPLEALSIGVGGLPGILSIVSDYYGYFLLAMAVAIVIPFVLTFLVGMKKLSREERGLTSGDYCAGSDRGRRGQKYPLSHGNGLPFRRDCDRNL